ncbi:MAG TPA: hypothetical protein VEH81_02155, partial [Ktedonobacteraceae bacterium]|nr:hypothetical protein [Ktedonobacteraceae bacterium]
MKRDVHRQPNKEKQQRSNVHEPSGSYVRSPALQSAEERRDALAQGARSRRGKTSRSSVRFASEEKLLNTGLSRKRLPRLNPNRAVRNPGIFKHNSKQQSGGLTTGWRSQTPSDGNYAQVEPQEKSAQETKQRAATVQAVTEEEQEKLATLE